MQLLLATRNPGKVKELKEALAGQGFTILTVDDFEDLPEVEEDAPTLEGNAVKKARMLSFVSGIAALADDTGLEVTALDGRPGVHSARYAGPDCNAEDNRRLLLEELEGKEDRSAQFRTAIAFVDPDEPQALLAEGICAGRIAESESGDKGFGYDPVFVPEGHSVTFAEMDAGEKNAISHRGKAVRKMAELLAARS